MKMNRKRVTLKDVAERSGVSPTMVSAVLNNRKGRICCSRERREKILAAARELNYRPNLLARSMAARTVPLVGIMLHLHKIDFQDGMNSYFLSVLPEITFRLNQLELEVLFIPYSSEQEQIKRLDHLVGNNLIGGVITNIMPWSYHQITGYLTQAELPYMILGEPDSGDLYSVRTMADLTPVFQNYLQRRNFKKIYSVTTVKGEPYFTSYPFRWSALRETPEPAEFNASDILFLVMGNSIDALLRARGMAPREKIILEAPDKESGISSGTPYLLVNNRPYREQLADYAAACLANWMQQGIPPAKQTHIIEYGADAVIKISGLET